MLYQISNGEVEFADDIILQQLNFEIRNTEKIAVVGRNGSGKTTLLKVISEEMELTNQSQACISKTGNLQIGYLKQIAFEDPSISLEEEIRKVFAHMEQWKKELELAAKNLETDYSDEKVKAYTTMEEQFKDAGGYYFEKEYDVLIRKFGFSEEERKKPLSEFSGGQQTKIAFIKLLLSKPDILLLDEPTNHLDITTIQWLEGYLKNYPKAVVIVSHDRMFLDNIVDVVYEIEYGVLKRYPGNYTNFVKKKQENYEKQRKDYQAQQKEIERLQKIIDRFKGKPTKVSMARSKEKAIAHMKLIQAPEEANLKTFHAEFAIGKETGKDVLLMNELAIGYDHTLSVVSLDLKKGEKLGVLGGNGLGKSTLLKTLVGKLPAKSGEFKFGANVEIGYFDQQMAMYQSDKTILADFWDAYPTLTETEVRNALGAFLFTGEEVYKNVSTLSGGEKVRLALCKIVKRRPNVLILDEPTNHMDIVGKETLENMLKEYKGTLIFVSHDRYFVKKIATGLLVFEDGTTNQYPFGYEQYQEKLDRDAQAEEGLYRKDSVLGGAISQNGNKQKKEEKTYYNPGKERSKMERKLKQAEEKLAQKEEQLEQLKTELLNPAYQSSYSKLTEIQNEIEELEAELLLDMEEWDQLATQLESV